MIQSLSAFETDVAVLKILVRLCEKLFLKLQFLQVSYWIFVTFNYAARRTKRLQ